VRFEWISLVPAIAMAGRLASASAQATESPCLEYGPAIVTLTGTITRHMEYGPPNYGEDPAHDERVVYWYLDVDKPICVNGKDGDTPEMESERDVRRLQIVYHGYPKGSGWIGHHVSITGTLFHAIWGRHFTKVLIDAMSTTKVP
jgi:hypothetical protein